MKIYKLWYVNFWILLIKIYLFLKFIVGVTIGEGLAKNKSLEYLSLKNNNIRTEGAFSIAKALHDGN